MTPFQNEAISTLKDLANLVGASLEISQNIDASKYVRCKILDLDIWLYPDGDADFSSPYIDRRFEKFDYANDTDLIRELTRSLQDTLQNRDHYIAYPEKEPRPLLNRMFGWITAAESRLQIPKRNNKR